MAMRKVGGVSLLAVTLAVACVTHVGAAWADGPESAYDDGGRDPSLSPNEYKVNVDGMREDPNAPMSDTARAYRNGLLTGRAAQKIDDQKAAAQVLPPIPRGQEVRSAAVVHPVAPPPVVERPVRPVEAYAPPPQPVGAPPEPVYAQQPVAYEPPPQPVPVYTQESYYAQAPAPAPVLVAQPVQYVQPVPVYAPPPPPVQYVYQASYAPPAPVVSVGLPIYAGARPVIYGGRWGYGGGWRYR